MLSGTMAIQTDVEIAIDWLESVSQTLAPTTQTIVPSNANRTVARNLI